MTIASEKMMRDWHNKHRAVVLSLDGKRVSISVNENVVAFFTGPDDRVSVESLLTALQIPWKTWVVYR